MGSVYTPDRWVMLKMTETATGRVTYKVLGTWLGGYLSGESWKISSGSEKGVRKGEYIEFPQCSGSTYSCHKDAYGTSCYTQGILSDFTRQMHLSGVGTIEVLDENFDLAQVRL